MFWAPKEPYTSVALQNYNRTSLITFLGTNNIPFQCVNDDYIKVGKMGRLKWSSVESFLFLEKKESEEVEMTRGLVLVLVRRCYKQILREPVNVVNYTEKLWNLNMEKLWNLV